MQSLKFKVSVRNHRITDDLPPEVPDGDAEVEIRFTTDAPAHLIEELKAQYLRRCPLYNLFHRSGCAMTENWHIDRKPV